MEKNWVLLAMTVLFYAADTTTNAAPSCRNCGSQPVPYPLSTGPDCGDQSYKVRCDSGRLQFDALNGSSYPIQSINSGFQRFVIQPADFVPNTCVTSDFRTEGIWLNSSLPFNVTSSNTIMYLNCSDLLLRSPLNCSSTSLCHSYINDTVEGSVCDSAPLCCTFRAGGSTNSYQIRVREIGCSAYRSFVNLDYSLPVSRWPDPGMEIQWVSPREPICRSQNDCQSTVNSNCAPDSVVNGESRCFCQSGFRWDPILGDCATIVSCQDPESCNGSKKKTVAGLTAGLAAASLVAIATFLVYMRHWKIIQAQERLIRQRTEILNSNSGGKSCKIFTGKQIKKATNNFSKDLLLGAGGFGMVFKGILEDGTIIAVKCVKHGNTMGTDQVLNEVSILCQVNHRYVVRLLGCCVDLQEPLLVYEYISNGTLFQHLHSLHPGQKNTLTWQKRLNIAHQAAQGLAYLHSSAVPPIYHRDVKSSNILLDEKLNVKIADFGISRLANSDLSHISTRAQGTFGYMDPEYFRNLQLTDKSDVYSFGVVLVELLTSQKALDFSRGTDDANLVVYVQRKMDDEMLIKTVDPMLLGCANKMDLGIIRSFALLALSCLEEKRQNRPSIEEIAERIGDIMNIKTYDDGGFDTNIQLHVARAIISTELELQRTIL